MVSIGKWSVLIFVILCACPGSLSEDTKKESVETVSLPQPQNIGPTPQNANKGTSEDVAAHMWQAPYEIHMVGDPREMRSGWIYQFGNQHPAAGDSQIYQGVPQEHWHKQLDAQVQSFAPSYRNIDQNSVAFNEVDPYAAYRAVGSPYPAAPKSWGPTQIKQTVNGQPDAPERDMSHMEIIKQAWEKSNLNVQKVAPQPKQVNDDAAKRPELPPLIFPKDVGQSDVIGASPLEPCSGEVLLSPEQPQILAQQPNQFEPQLRQQMPMLDRNPQQQPIQQSTLQQQPMQQQPMQQRPMQQPTLQQQPMQQQPMQQQPMQQSTLQQPNLQQQPMQLPTFQQRIPMNGQNFNVQQQPMGTPTNLRQQMPMYDQTQNMQPQQQIDPIAQIPDTNLRQQMPMYAPTQNLQRTPSNAGQIPADNLRQQMMVPAQQKTSLKQSDERQLAQQQQFQLQQAPGLVQGQNLRQQMTALSDLDQRQMPQQQVAQQQTIAFAQPQTMNQQPMLQQDQSQTSNQRQMPQTQTFTVANSRIQGENVQPATQQQASQNLVLNVNPDQQHMFIIDQQMPQSRLQQPAPQQQMLIPTQNTPQQMTFTQNAQQQPMYLPEQHPVVQQQQMPSFAQNLPSTNVDQMPTWGQTQDNQPQMPTSLNVQMQTENMPYQPSNQQIDQVKLDEMKAIMEDMPDVRTIHLIKKLKKQQNHQPNVYITIPAVYGGYAGGYSSPSSYARPSSYYRSSSYGYGNSPWIGSSNPATTGSDQPAQTSGGPANSKSDSSSAPGSPTDKSSLTGDEFQEMIASENITTSRTLHTSPIAAEDDDLIAAASEADTVEIRDESDGRVCNCKHNHIEQDDDEEHHVAAVPIDIHPDGSHQLSSDMVGSPVFTPNLAKPYLGLWDPKGLLAHFLKPAVPAVAFQHLFHREPTRGVAYVPVQKVRSGYATNRYPYPYSPAEAQVGSQRRRVTHPRPALKPTRPTFPVRNVLASPHLHTVSPAAPLHHPTAPLHHPSAPLHHPVSHSHMLGTPRNQLACPGSTETQSSGEVVGEPQRSAKSLAVEGCIRQCLKDI